MAEGGIEQNEVPLPDDIWADEQAAAAEIKRFQRPLDFSEMVDGARVFLIGVNHADPAPHDLIYYSVDELKQAGITHFVLEVSREAQPVFDRLNTGEEVSDDELNRVFRGQSKQESEFNQLSISGTNIVKQLVKQGIKVVAIDTSFVNLPIAPHSNFHPDDLEAVKKYLDDFAVYEKAFKVAIADFLTNSEGREKVLLTNLKTIVDQNPKNKVAGLFGTLHMHRNFPVGGNTRSLVSRLDEKGIPTRTALSLGGFGKYRDKEAERFNRLVERAGLDRDEFVLDMGKYNNSVNKSVPYGPGNMNFIIHMMRPVRKGSS